MNKRYVVVTSPEQAKALKPEKLELATCLNSPDGAELLIYRDSFVAYKVATMTGGQVRRGDIVSGVNAEGDLTLEDGSRLRLERAFSTLS